MLWLSCEVLEQLLRRWIVAYVGGGADVEGTVAWAGCILGTWTADAGVKLYCWGRWAGLAVVEPLALWVTLGVVLRFREPPRPALGMIDRRRDRIKKKQIRRSNERRSKRRRRRRRSSRSKRRRRRRSKKKKKRDQRRRRSKSEDRRSRSEDRRRRSRKIERSKDRRRSRLGFEKKKKKKKIDRIWAKCLDRMRNESI